MRIRYDESKSRGKCTNHINRDSVAGKTKCQECLDYYRLLKEKFREAKFGVVYPTWWLCDCCSNPISYRKREIRLDHDHVTGLFRGWLCVYCNAGVGFYEVNGEMFQKYLERTK
jgi:hypothetical protein